MSRNPLLLLLAVLTLLLSVQGCSARGTVPTAADSMAEQMDKQILARFGHRGDGDLSTDSIGTQNRQVRERLNIMGTVPVNINNLEVSCALGRQMMEEVSRWFINAGYKVQELRKGRDIFFQQRQGEMVLTRDTRLLATRSVTSEAILAGTYVVSPDQVRFSLRLIHTPSNEVLAMGTATVPITPDVRPLLVDTAAGPVKVTPSVNTRLQ